MSFLARSLSRSAIVPRCVSRRVSPALCRQLSVRSPVQAQQKSLKSISTRRAFSAMAANQSTTHGIVNQNERPEPDQVLKDIADYVHNYEIDSPLAVRTPRPPEYLVTVQTDYMALD